MLYINGLERTGVGWPERLLSWLFSRKYIDLHFTSVDWHGNGDVIELRSKVVVQAKEILASTNQLTLVGVSAGASLALSVFVQLRQEFPDASIKLVCISGRLQLGDRNHLVQTALHRKGKKPSIAYLHSVVDCDEQFVNRLTVQDKLLITIYKPLLDCVVPVGTMSIVGVEQHRVLAVGHLVGVVMGLARLLHNTKDSYNTQSLFKGVK